MDPTRFDGFVRTLGAAASRRHAFRALLAGIVAARGSGQGASAARKRGKSHRTGKDKGGGKGGRHTRKEGGRRLAHAAANSGACCKGSGCAPGSGKNLAGCCFEGRDLAGQNFNRSNLKAASFRGSSLTNATFAQANLENACLVDADLTGAAFTGANLSKSIRCRTRTGDGGLDNSGCGKGTICCPTCDAEHACDAGQVCCAGRCVLGACCVNGAPSACGSGAVCCASRCVDGDCCGAEECAAKTCHTATCQDHACTYQPVHGEAGQNCPPPRICCQDALGDPVCCGAAVTACQPNGRCGCGLDADCGVEEKCCKGTCAPKSRCCEGSNPAGCGGALRCCTIAGKGVCRECCGDDDCPNGQTCSSGTCEQAATTFERVRTIVALLLNVDEAAITMETEFIRDLNADSLDIVELVLALEAEFGLEITDEELEALDMRTVGDAVLAIDELSV